jgi:hypothetical protein
LITNGFFNHPLYPNKTKIYPKDSEDKLYGLIEEMIVKKIKAAVNAIQNKLSERPDTSGGHLVTAVPQLDIKIENQSILILCENNFRCFEILLFLEEIFRIKI